jgi:predicted  nucleic acid-binding Zn-ribbon protein
MILRFMKYGAMGAAGLCLVGGLFFGRDAASYVYSSVKSVQTAVKDAVPVEFELQRARDLLENIIPEMQANVRLIAQEEVEIATLKDDIEQNRRSLSEERIRVVKLRDALATPKVTYTLGGNDYTPQQVKEELARSFDRYKEAEVVLAGKQRLMETRQKSLQAAIQMLERTKSQKVRLEDQIQALDSQYRLGQAASGGSKGQIDNTKLAPTEKLIRQIRNRLDVAERVLAHEARFVQPIAIDTIDEKDLLAQVDEYMNPVAAAVPTTLPAVACAPAPEAR